MRKFLMFTLFAAAAAAIGCAKKEAPPAPEPAPAPAPAVTPAPVAIGGVTLGKDLGADKKVVTPLDTFGVHDTIYASVETTGVGHAKLRALWSFVKGDKTAKVNEQTIEIDATGPAATEFHIQSAKPWPKGAYRVDVFLNDGLAPAATGRFKVQ